MVTEWSRGGPEGNRTLIVFATGRSLRRTTGRAEPYRTFVLLTTGRSRCELQGVRFTHCRVRVLQGEVDIPMIGMFHFMYYCICYHKAVKKLAKFICHTE